MDSTELANELARNSGYTGKEVARLLASVANIIGEEVQEGRPFACQGLGEFSVRKEMEHVAADPVTGQRLLVPPSLTLVYEAAPELKEKLANLSTDE